MSRVVIVTGAGAGLGRAYALDLAARGMSVVVNNRRREVCADGLGSAERVAREITAAGGIAIPNEDDVRDVHSGERMVQQALEAFGRLDAFVSNAGVDQARTFHKISLDAFREIFDINFYGALYGVHAAYAHMREKGHGRIVVSTSSAGLHGLHGLSAYASSKAALIGLMQSVAMEGQSRDVFCNAVAPYASTRMTESHADPHFIEAMRPEYVSPLVAMLVAADCKVNGQTIVAGGGYFRRAAMVEGPGAAYPIANEVTPEMLQHDAASLQSLDAAMAFTDAMSAFNEFSARSAIARKASE